ncbi:MAG: MmgE/PrpD family protein [Euryarchaeota archaeon]|nr:MmgE/PrpD family protein [Euryarchaeota archaeon]MBV1729704.1 MmgE/PrpD family protein [Methanobacterium sp.]MBU4547200.1 MmgE/PrpD family protein [Euryarchaeota archaeon]MBU4607952.1 MmgE/PrpD family protein [Euryarchaeota archaeon]MBV1754981.1 MmgE/PrpD family protein [Methanobacterium sp.]
MITAQLASFIIDLQINEIPLFIREKAKLCLMDFLGVSLRGSREKSSQAIWDMMESIKLSPADSSKEITVLGHGGGGLLESCLINGISAHALDLDDGHRMAQLHPGCSVIPAALALAEYHNKSGKEFLEALVAGYEVAIVLGIMVNPVHRNLGFHSTSTLGVFGAAAASSKILGLNFEETVNALGLAGTQSAGFLESGHSGSMGKHLHAGHAAHSGVISALLAQKGFTGSSSILEGEEGFLNCMCLDIGKKRDLDDTVTSLLGQFHIKDVYLKKYPVCRHLHSSIDSACQISKEFNLKRIKINQIDHIMVQTYKTAAEHDNYYPETPESLRQSLPLSIAITLHRGDLGMDDVKAISQLSPEVRALSQKITIELDEKLDNLQPHKRPSRVTVTYTKKNNISGNKVTNSYSIEKTTFLPQGESENPFTKEEILHKFQFLNPGYDIQKLEILNEMESLPIRYLMGNFN